MSFLPVARRPLILRLAAAGTAVVAAAVLALPAGGTSAEAAGGASRRAANPVTPGSFTGYGFDQCLTPTQKAMDAWLTSSPFWAVGIYISGNSRACRNQPNLTPAWVTTQLANGWRLLPITLGPQAYCNPRYPKYQDDPVINRSSTNNYAAAKGQGVTEAGKAVAAAQALGLAPRSTLWYDIEAFDIKNDGCRRSTIQFLSGWTEQIRALGYVSGVYSSGASGIRAVDNARVKNATFSEPDMIWVADWNGQATVETPWLREGAWLPGRRVHQYRGGHDEVHGRVRINIDSNFLDVGKGSVAPQGPVHCDGVTLDFPRYFHLDVGSTATLRIKAAQCLLREQGFYGGRISGVYNRRTASATSAYRVKLGMPASSRLGKPVWIALLSTGAAPLLKYGAAADDVRRLQRALNAAGTWRLAVTGTFESTTAAAVKAYQAAHELPATGVVTSELWAMLQSGTR